MNKAKRLRSLLVKSDENEVSRLVSLMTKAPPMGHEFYGNQHEGRGGSSSGGDSSGSSGSSSGQEIRDQISAHLYDGGYDFDHRLDQKTAEEIASNFGVKPDVVHEEQQDRNDQWQSEVAAERQLLTDKIQEVKDNAEPGRTPKMGDHAIIGTASGDVLVQVGRGGRQSTEILPGEQQGGYYGPEWAQHMTHVVPKGSVDMSGLS